MVKDQFSRNFLTVKRKAECRSELKELHRQERGSDTQDFFVFIPFSKILKLHLDCFKMQK